MCYCLKLNLGSFCHLMMNDSRTHGLGLTARSSSSPGLRRLADKTKGHSVRASATRGGRVKVVRLKGKYVRSPASRPPSRCGPIQW